MISKKSLLATVTTSVTAGVVLAGLTWMTSSQTGLALGVADDTRTFTVNDDVPPALELDDAVLGLERAFERAAEHIRPSVVSIVSTRTIERRTRRQDPFEEFFGDDFFERFFGPGGRPDRDGNDEPETREFQQRGLGSGLIVSRDGHILTNNHVIAEADELEVQLFDGRQYSAEVIGTDERTDVAIIKIDTGNLVPARLGDSDELRIGRWVIAAGSPFGLEHSFTAGIVSATGRARLGITDYEDFIQTDAAINRGNSGGPLITLNGEVVGLNTAIFSRTGGAMGVGFAIPINMARGVMESLIEHGEVVRGWLGVEIRDLTEDMARAFGYDSADGVLIENVLPDSPAEAAGLEPGDIVVSYGGRRADNIVPFRNFMARQDPGTELDIVVWREGEGEVDLTVTIGRMPEDPQLARSAPGGQRPDAPGRAAIDELGIVLGDLTDEVRQRLDLDENISGAVILDVEPGSPAARAGLRPGIIIQRVFREEVEDAAHGRELIESHELSEGVRLRVFTGQRSQFLFLQVQ